MTPRQIVAELDKYVVGQQQAKRAVAIALRNRWRRQQLPARAGRGDRAQEHPDDRPDRRRQDRDRPPPGPPRQGPVPQGRGQQVHRGGLCRARRRVHGARPGGDRRRHGQGGEARGGARGRRRPRRGPPAPAPRAAAADHRSYLRNEEQEERGRPRRHPREVPRQAAHRRPRQPPGGDRGRRVRPIRAWRCSRPQGVEEVGPQHQGDAARPLRPQEEAAGLGRRGARDPDPAGGREADRPHPGRPRGARSGSSRAA